MNYKLAKQLKDAGFPQGKFENNNYLSPFGVPKEIFVKEFPNEVAYNPTLSELIDACGDGTGVVRINSKESNAWNKRLYDPDKANYFAGKTPEEAVAKLWLKLNK